MSIYKIYDAILGTPQVKKRDKLVTVTYPIFTGANFNPGYTAQNLQDAYDVGHDDGQQIGEEG